MIQRIKTRAMAMAAAALILPLTAVTSVESADADTISVISEGWAPGQSEPDRVYEIAINSPSADGPVKWVRLYVPPGWSKDSGQHYPTLWMLHGGFDNHLAWEGDGKGEGRLKELTANRNVLVVVPETSWCSAYSDWKNYDQGGSPKWETYLIDELDPLLRQSYGASTDRAVGGMSMGGLGSFGLSQRNPGFFKAAASYSGNLDPLHRKVPGDPEKPGLACGADWVRVWGDYADTTPRTDGTLNGVQTWELHDPVLHPTEMTGMPLYIAAGDESDPLEGRAHLQAEAMVAELQNEAGIYPTTRIPANAQTLPAPAGWDPCDGGHSWSCWNLEIRESLSVLLPAIGVPYTPPN